MKSKEPILARYQTALSKSKSDKSTLREFLHNTLGIPKCSYSNFLEEILARKVLGNTNFDQIQEVYRRLQTLVTTDSDSANAVK